ncbi:MAG: hypothetical protein DCC65_05360 [Planctomycetota bacterium]|nr:MAG: hypothetical protein DCC65_05360 [Planctomycetota bacterium]
MANRTRRAHRDAQGATQRVRPGNRAASGNGNLSIILVCFFLSGYAGLLYETAWTRQFAFVFGTSELAVTTVLAGYFGGLTIGAAVAGRWAARIRRPVLVYGVLEAGIALAALAMPLWIRASTGLYVAWFGGRHGSMETGGLTTAVFYLACSFAVLLVPTAMMGATLPLLARYAVSTNEQVGPRVGLLYALNTVGAVLGTVMAAFTFLPALGLTQTIRVGVLINFIVFAAAVAVARRPQPQSPVADRGTAADRSAESMPRGQGLILPMMLISGAVSFTYEVLWTRLLGHILGASVYAFATMLASFLLGIALGAAIASRTARHLAGSLRGFAWVQALSAATSLGAYLLIDLVPDMARGIGAGAGAGLWTNAAVAALILLPGAMCIGSTFPLAVRILARDESDVGRSSARVYAWNTVGAIAGATAAGFVVLPSLKYAGSLSAAVGVNVLLCLAATAMIRPAVRLPMAVCGAVLVTLFALHPDEPWAVLRASALGRRPAGGEITYYAVGRGATVLMTDDGIGWDIRTNGLPEANIRRKGVPPGRVAIQQWQGALPVLARPHAKRMLFVGLGGGVATESVPLSVERIDVVEIEEEVVAANRSVGGERAIDPLADPRVRVIVNDARNALLLAPDRYDIIISQPSHPWTAGASHLYTREFMTLARERLAPDGVLLQWMLLSFVDEALYRSLIATMTDVFAEVEVYAPYPGAVLLLGSNTPLRIWERAAKTIAERPRDFYAAGIVAAEDVLASLELDTPAARRFSGGPLITDDFNLLQLRSRRSEEAAVSSWKMTDATLAGADPALATEATSRRSYLVARILTRSNVGRARRVADAATGADRLVLAGQIHAWEGRLAEAAGAYHEALEAAPESRAARFGLIRAGAADYLRGDSRLAALAAEAPDPERAVFEGWKLTLAKQWTSLEALEERLAAATVTDDWHADAQRLRARWRVQSGDAHRAREAAAIIDTFAARFGTAEDYQLRAEAFEAAGEPLGVLGSLHEAAMLLRATAANGPAAVRNLELLKRLPGELATSEAARRAREKLESVAAARR